MRVENFTTQVVAGASYAFDLVLVNTGDVSNRIFGQIKDYSSKRRWEFSQIEMLNMNFKKVILLELNLMYKLIFRFKVVSLLFEIILHVYHFPNVSPTALRYIM